MLPTNPLLQADEGYQETEELLQELETEIAVIYSKCSSEMYLNAVKFLEWFTVADEAQRLLFEEGKLSAEDYKNWRRNQILSGQHWYAMAQTLLDNLDNAAGIAYSVINAYLPEAYAINGNYTFYEIEHGLGISTAFTLYDEQTVEKLIREKPDLLPHPTANIPELDRWNMKNLTAKVTQGIIQGDSVDELAKRLREVSTMNQNSAVRNAITMTTAAQSMGRMDSYKRAQDMGINVKVRWLATLDGLTRPSHRACDGLVRKVGEKFPNGLEFPGDPNGRPEEVYNCRCCPVAAFDDQPFSNEDRAQDIYREDSKVRNMTYDEWKAAKGNEALFKADKNANKDFDMMKEYRELLGSKIPDKIRDFQELKYGDPEKWKKIKSEARKARNRARRAANG